VHSQAAAVDSPAQSEPPENEVCAGTPRNNCSPSVNQFVITTLELSSCRLLPPAELAMDSTEPRPVHVYAIGMIVYVTSSVRSDPTPRSRPLRPCGVRPNELLVLASWHPRNSSVT
jgi:hypothetical protein